MVRTRTKVFLWLFAVILSSAAAFVGTSIWYLRSERFQEFVQKLAVSELERATGLSCGIERLRFDPFRGSFQILKCALNSPPGAAEPVHVTADEISGSLRLRSILTLKLNLAELKVIRPRVDLTTGKGDSQWNPEGFLKAYRTSLDLEAGDVRLTDGWVNVKNGQVPFELSLNDLVCEVHYRPKPPAYRVHIAYRNARFNWSGRPLAYDLDVRAVVMVTGVDFESVALRYGKTRLNGDGWMREWKSPVVLLHAAGSVAAVDLSVFEEALRDAGGDINVQANFRWDAAGFRSTARFTAAAASYRRIPVSSLRGIMEIEKGVLTLSDVEGQVGAGPVQAEAVFHLLPADPKQHHCQITAKGVSLRDVAGIIDVPDIAFKNNVDGSVRLTWRHGNRDLELNSEIQLHEPPAASAEGVMQTPLQGSVALRFSRGIWFLSSASLHSLTTEVEAVGTGQSGFHLQLRTRRAAEIFGILRNFSSSLRATLAKYRDLADISGNYELAGDVAINPSGAVSYQGSIHLSEGRWRSYAIDSLTARIYWDGTELDLQSLKAVKEGGSAEGSFHLSLAEGEGLPPELSFQGSIHQLPLATLAGIGIEIGEGVSGVLSGSGSISSREGDWEAEGQATIENGSYKGEAFDSLRGHGRLAGGTLRIADGQLIRGPGKLRVEGQVGLEKREMDLTVRIDGFSLRSLPAVQENKADVDGTVSAAGRVQGSFDNPGLTGSLTLEGLRYSNWDLGQGKGTVELKNKVLSGEADIRSTLGAFKVQASISVEPRYEGTAFVELKDWNVRKLITGNVPPYLRDLSTALQGSVRIKGPFAEPSLLTYEGEMDGARFKFHDYELSNSGKIRFSVNKRTIQNIAAKIVGEGTSLALTGDIPLDEKASLDMRLDGNLNLKILDQVEKSIQVSGSADLNVRATGTARNPQVIGKATLKNVRLDYGDFPSHLSGVRGDIVFSRNLVRFENVEGAVASGTFRLSGALEQQNAELRGINLEVSARKARFPYPKDFRSTVDADLTLRGSPESQMLAGEVRVIRSEYLREFNLLEQLASRNTNVSGPLTSDPFLVGLRLNIGIRSDEGLYVDNELTKLRGSTRLTLRGTPAYPSLTGRIEANDGSIFFRGNRFNIVRASADFIDRNRINPTLDVRAEADVKSYRLVLDVNGDLDHLRFNVSSDPPLSTVDILTLLTTGKEAQPGDINSRRQAEITGLSAASILSEGLTGVLGKRVQRIFGLQTFRVDPFLAGAENDPTARVTISERVSKDLTITFSRNLSTNEEQIIIIEYEVGKNLSVIGTRDENGKFGLDFTFRKRFR